MAPTQCPMNISEILNLFNHGKGTAKSHMKNLIEMAAVDGNFQDIEYDLLKTIAKRNSISENQLMEIRENPGGVKLEVPSDEKKKFHQKTETRSVITHRKNTYDESLC